MVLTGETPSKGRRSSVTYRKYHHLCRADLLSCFGSAVWPIEANGSKKMDNNAIQNIDIKRLDLNLLRIFDAVSKEKNVSRAAESLGLSQPAVSSAMTRLRRHLHDPLFVRTSHGVRLTPFAEQLMAPVEGALSLIEAALLSVKTDFNPSLSHRTFTLLMTDIGQSLYLGPVAKRLMRQSPGVTLNIRRLSYRRVADALSSGTADLAIGYVGHLSGELVYERLFESGLACLVRRGHPSIGDTLSREQYLSALHLVESSGVSSSGFVTKALAAVGASRQSHLAVPSFLAMPAIVAASDLVATIPRELVPHIGHRKELKILEFPIEVPAIEVGLCWSPHRHNDVALQWLRGILVELFAQETTN